MCYPGPSDYFKHCAKEALANGNEVYAKMQIACSHDLASVLYIPVTGLTYDRITDAVKGGITLESGLVLNIKKRKNQPSSALLYQKKQVQNSNTKKRNLN